MDVYGAVGWRWRCIRSWRFERIGEGRAEEEVPSGTRACVLFGEVGSVAVDVEDHAACMVPECCVWMGGSIIEELGDGNGGGCGAVVLLRGEGAEGNEHGVVDGSGIVEEGSDDGLETGELGGVERW